MPKIQKFNQREKINRKLSKSKEGQTGREKVKSHQTSPSLPKMWSSSDGEKRGDTEKTKPSKVCLPAHQTADDSAEFLEARSCCEIVLMLEWGKACQQEYYTQNNPLEIVKKKDTPR